MADLCTQVPTAALAEAWTDVPYPGDDKIFISESYDDEGIVEYFAGKPWKGHSVAALRAHSSAISTFFTPEAYRYWLPAYLFAAVEDLVELSQGIDVLLSSLGPDQDSDWSRNNQHARLSLLTRRQLQVVADVIEHLANRLDIQGHSESAHRERGVVVYLREVCERRVA